MAEGPFDHPVWPAGAAGVFRQEGGINTSEPERGIGEMFFQDLDRFPNAGVPVGHDRGDENEIRERQSG